MAVIATAEVRVIADTSRFLSNLRRQLRGSFGQAGAASAQQFTREFGRNLSGDLTDTLRQAAQRGTRGMREAGRNAATGFTDGFSGSIGRLSDEALSSLRTQTLIQGAAVQGGDTANAFIDGLRSRLDQRLTREAQEALAPFFMIPPVFTRIGNESGEAYAEGVGTALRRRLAPIASEIVGIYADLGRIALPSIRAFTNAVRREARLTAAFYRDMGASISGALAPIFDRLGSDAQRAFGALQSAAQATGRRLRSEFARLGPDLADAFSDLGSRTLDSFAVIGGNLRTIFDNAYNAVSQRTLRFNAELIRHWTTGAEFVEQETQSIFTRMWRGVADMGGFQIGIIARDWTRQLGGIFSGIGGNLSRAFSGVQRAASRAANGVVAAFAPAARQVGSFFRDVATSFGGVFTAAGRRAASQFNRAFSSLARQSRATGRRFADGFVESFSPIASRVGRLFNLIPWQRLGQGVGRLFGRGTADGAEDELGRRGQSLGRRFGQNLTRGLTTGIQGLGRALAAISLRPLQGLAGILRNATSEMLSMGAQVLALVALLESLSGLLFALPAAVSVLGAGIATAAVAFNGFGSAVGAAFDDLDAFNEAIEDLAPSAQAVAREFREIAPALSDIRVDAQQALFAQLDGTITAVADTLLGPLREGLTVASTALGGLVAEIGAFFAQAATGDTVTATFETLATIFDGLAQSAQPFLEGMRALVDQFLPRIAEAAGPLSELGEQFRAWAERVTETGQAMEAFDFAVSVFQTLAGIVGDLAGIFQAMFSAAELAGVNALGAIGEALEVIRTAFESFEGQVALANVFGAIGDAVTALAPVFATLITQLGLVFPIVAQIAEALGPSLSVVLEGLGQALLALGPGIVEVFAGIAAAAEAIAPSLAPLGEALGAILTAIAPILPVLGELIGIVVELGAQIISVLASAIGPIVEALAGALAPILPQLADLFSRLVEALAPVIEALGAGLANVIATLLPPILELVLALADALMPVIEALLPVLTPLIEIFFQLVEIVGSLLVPVIALLLPLIEALSPLFELIGVVLTPVLELLTAILEPITTLITLIAEALTPVIEFFAEIIGAVINVALVPLTAAFEFFADILADHVIPWIEEAAFIMEVWWNEFILPLIGHVRDLASRISDNFGSIRDTVTTVMSAVGTAISGAIDWVSDFAGDVADFLGDAGDTISGFGDTVGDIMGAVGDFFSDAASAVSSAVQSIIGWVQDAIDTVSSFDLGDLNPFANGGIVTRATPALIGEAGKEVVIPLTRPARAQQLAEQSGLIDLLSSRGVLPGGGGDGGGAPVVGEMHVHSQNADPEQVARRAARILERRMSGRGLERVP